MRLKDPAIKKAKPTDKPQKLSDGQGLHLLIMPTGGKLWRWSYRFNGKQKTAALGAYPEITLAEARRKVVEGRKSLANEIDPIELKKTNKRAELLASTNSFEAVARLWHEQKSRKWAKVTADKAMTHLQAYVFPEIGYMPITAIKAPALLAMLRKIEAQGIAYTATRIRENCGQIFRFGIASGFCEDNPVTHLLGAIQKPAVTHRPAITERREFGQFLRDLRTADGRFDPLTVAATRFAMLTFVRAQEFRFARWEEFDLQSREWKVPAHRMKTGKTLPAHTVPLSTQALTLLEGLRTLSGYSDYLFPKQKGGGVEPVISENTVGKLLNKIGYQHRQCAHGFRASARSMLSEMGFSREAMEPS